MRTFWAPALLLALFLILPSASAQQGQIVTVSDCPIGPNCVQQFFTDGMGNTINICYAASIQPPTVFDVPSGTLVSIAVAANAGTINFLATSFLWVGAQITVGGATTPGLNGTYKVTAVSGTTASIVTSGVGNGTYNNTGLTVTTRAPLLNAQAWALKVFVYTGTTLNGAYWAGAPSSTIPFVACSSRASF